MNTSKNNLLNKTIIKVPVDVLAMCYSMLKEVFIILVVVIINLYTNYSHKNKKKNIYFIYRVVTDMTYSNGKCESIPSITLFTPRIIFSESYLCASFLPIKSILLQQGKGKPRRLFIINKHKKYAFIATHRPTDRPTYQYFKIKFVFIVRASSTTLLLKIHSLIFN